MFVEQLPSGRWRGGFRAPVTRRKITQTFDYQYEAEVWAAESERRAAEALAAASPVDEDGTPVEALRRPAPTVAAHGVDWVERRRGSLAPATLANYRHHLTALTLTGIGRRPMDQLRRSDIERWQTAQVEEGVGRPTVNARLKLLRMIYKDAMAEHLVVADPAAPVDYLTTDIKPDRVLTDKDEAATLAAAADADTRLQILLGLDAGLRWSEVFALPADAVPGDYLVVRQVIERDTGKIRRYPKGHRSRVVPLTERLAEVLIPAAERAAERGHDALLFTSRSGGPVDYFNYRHRVWRPLGVAANLRPRPTFHDLRHTYGSRLAAAGVPRSEIATLMGHADEETTKRYIHAGDDGRRLAMVRAALG